MLRRVSITFDHGHRARRQNSFEDACSSCQPLSRTVSRRPPVCLRSTPRKDHDRLLGDKMTSQAYGELANTLESIAVHSWLR